MYVHIKPDDNSKAKSITTKPYFFNTYIITYLRHIDDPLQCQDKRGFIKNMELRAIGLVKKISQLQNVRKHFFEVTVKMIFYYICSFTNFVLYKLTN